MARAKKTEFDLGEYVRQSTSQSGVPEKVQDQDRLYGAARLVVPRLPKQSESRKGRSATSRAT
jgi:hypothetical protein